ncbi:TcdA/TcdB pore-forming domain-containing protein [Pseudomonas mandelii]|uniref:TcdA/TcdB pore-forming domain-containing protein n=1 Tax=Pseudomonas mandelii TaxID=75612 RepID=UPI0020A01278|nr:TcdA/TcdB pore-forming domain-containing protein [Pseudomonas mandelii]MCO8313030.1 toxin [Pseudomonas mandelii]
MFNNHIYTPHVGDYVKFINLFKVSDLELALISHKGTAEYDAVFRYYFGCIGLLDSPRLVEPLGLLKQVLASFIRPGGRQRRTIESLPESAAPNLSDIYERLDGFEIRLANGVQQLQTPATPVPDNLHFVWLGGGIGDVQCDYINIWKQTLAGEGYTLKLWYDSDALLAYEANRIIVEAVKADAMLSGGQASSNAIELGDKYEERFIALKQQMFMHINKAIESGENADDARIGLLVRGYGQNEDRLKALRESNRRSLLALSEGGIVLRDLATAATPLYLQAIYEREISLRGNFAAASDVVRAEVLFAEGGSYADVDNLPPLVENLGGVDISRFGLDARTGVLQLILDHSPEWMPGRQVIRSKYPSYVEQIPLEHREALERFAQSSPDISDVFRRPVERKVRPDGLRAVAEQSTLSNAFMMAHPGSAMLKAVLDRFRFNYEVVDATARLAIQRKIALIDAEAVIGVAKEVVEKRFGPLNELSMQEEISISFLVEAAATYYSDGIRPQSEVTIYLTGPAAMRDGLADYEKMHFTPRGAEASRAEVFIPPLATVNRATEEELNHSWKENESNTAQWLSKEKQRWESGQFKARYVGKLDQLLNNQAILFDNGWPVIEGRHVLSTDLLQSLADSLGEPFLQAMSQRADGVVTFTQQLQLGFDERQSILAQEIELPPLASPDEAAIRDLPIDELLRQIGKGFLRVEQLNPLQRLLMGALVGAKALDQRSFDVVSARLENLANTVSELGVSHRYGAIEQELFKQNHPAFLAGLASASNPHATLSETSVDLKRQALDQSLTLIEWGRRVAKIQHVAKLEYRDWISEQMDEVLESFDHGSFKMVPQDLLLEGMGDRVAGRCYPLALAMAAALDKGNSAANTLRERFYLAVTEPQDRDSRVFVNMIEELRDVPVDEIGTSLERSDLTRIVAMLEEKTVTTSMMLNSDNHSMLVAKVFEGEHSIYLFYDPNFGICEFVTPLAFNDALTHFFIVKQRARHYAAFGDEQRPTFDLIELDTVRLNKRVLASGIEVSSLSAPGALPEQTLSRVRQRVASARGRSLVNNVALGSSLRELDAHWWGEQIAQATRQLQTRHQLSADAVPLFETLEVTPGGEYKISLVDLKAGQTMAHVTTDDHRILRIKEFLSGLFETLVSKQQSPVSEFDPTDAGSVHTLNAGFTLQALMNALRHHEGAASGGDNALTTAIRLHAYVNYAQLAHGNVVDVVGIVKLVRQALDDEKLIARTSAPLVQRALGHIANEGVGTVLGLVNVGFDIYQLSHATNDIEKAQFGTQLAFDSASVALAAAGLGAALAGAGTVAAVLGGGGVILGGLAVGVAALAEGFATIAEEAKEVALFFDGLEKAYLQGGYHLDKASNAWIAHPSLVFADLDLHQSTVRFDSPKLFPLRDHFGVPDFDVDYARATDIRQGLELPGSAPFSPQAGQTIVLPCTPRTWYGYEYKLLPFVTFRHAGGFDTARRLEKKNEQGQWQFLFSFYSFPGEYVVNRLYPVYKPTVFNVRLDNIERSLVVPALPKAWHGMVSYRIEGAGSQCSVLLNPGVSLELDAPSHIAMGWVLLAPWLAEADILIEAAGRLVSNTLGVKFSGKGAHDVLLKLAGNKIMRVDLVALRLEVVEEDADPALGEQALLDHFKSLAREHRLAMPYTPVHEFVVPFEKPEEPRTVAAYYDSARDRFLYIRDPQVILADESILGVVVEDFAYFYHPESFDVWQVDATTGTLVQRYRLLTPQGIATIIRCEVTAHGAVQIVQQILRNDGQHEELTYLIHDRAVWLSSITLDVVPALQPVLDADMLTDWKQVLGDYVLLRESSNTVNWRPGALVSICWQLDDRRRDLIWVRDYDGLIIRAPARRHHSRGWNDSIKALADLLLIAPAGVEGEVFVTFDKTDRRLVRQQRSIVEGRAQWTSSGFGLLEVKNVVAVERGYLALTNSGLFFNVMPDGHLRLGGVTESWLKDRTQWWSALATVATQYPVSSFAILGLTGLRGDAGLCAWYLDDRLLLADLGQGKEVRLLSIAPDTQTVWLFDLSTGKIVRQGFIDPDRLDAAFAQGTKLLQAEALPAPMQEWASWTFVDVTVEGAGLRATTREGVELDLQHNEPARITGVDSRWVAAQGGELRDGLAALANEHRCADFLCVKDPDYLQWYVVRTGRLIRVPTSATDAQYALLGTQKQTNVMLHEHADGFVHTYPQENKIGPFVYIQRNDEVLTVEGPMMGKDLLPLIADDVSILVLKMGQGSITSRLTRAAWLKLESVIIDCRYSLDHPPKVPGKLIWDSVAVDRLWVNRVDEHLVIVDSDSGHSLIFRQVFAVDPALRGDVFVALGRYQSFAVSKLVSALLARKDTFSSVLLNKLLSGKKVEAAGS